MLFKPVILYGKSVCSRHCFQFPALSRHSPGRHWCLIIHQRGPTLTTTPSRCVAWHPGCVPCQTHLWDLFPTPPHFSASFLFPRNTFVLFFFVFSLSHAWFSLRIFLFFGYQQLLLFTRQRHIRINFTDQTFCQGILFFSSFFLTPAAGIQLEGLWWRQRDMLRTVNNHVLPTLPSHEMWNWPAMLSSLWNRQKYLLQTLARFSVHVHAV